MKKALLLIATCCLMIGACAQIKTQNTQTKENKDMKKTLVVYFSAAGGAKDEDGQIGDGHQKEFEYCFHTKCLFRFFAKVGASEAAKNHYL